MRRRFVIVAATVALLGVVGVFSPAARAGTGSPQTCTDGGQWGRTYVPILQSPIMLGLEFNVVRPTGGALPVFHAALCYSTSPYGWGDDPSEKDTTGGRIEVNVYDDYRWDSSDLHSASCEPQSNPSGLSTSCYVGTTPTVLIGEWGRDFTLLVPVTACFGSCSTVGPTGVIVGQFPLTQQEWWRLWLEDVTDFRPAGTDTGGGVVTPSLSYCVNGTCTPLTGSTQVGAGIDNPGGPRQPWWEWYPGTLTCVISTCVTGTVDVHVGSTLAAVQVGSTTIPVTNPAGPVNKCVYVMEVVYETLYPGTNVPTPC